MKHSTLLNTLRHVAIFLAVIGLFGVWNEVSAQKGRTGAGTGQLISQFAPIKGFLRMDFSGDLLADIAVVDSASATWFVYSADNTMTSTQFGSSLDKPVPADYDGDKVEDMAVLQSVDGSLNWHILQSSDRNIVEVSWGVDGDIAVQGDYDGDGRADFAVWRPSEALWHILASSTGGEIILECGMVSDKPMPGDYDGDGTMDAAVYRSSEHSFYYLASSTQLMNEQPFGAFFISRYSTFAPADFDGDGRTDFAVFNPTNRIWTILESSTAEYRQVAIESNSPACIPSELNPCKITDFALPADYDNDGSVDPGMWSCTDQMVFAVGSTKGRMKIATENTLGMTAVSSFFMTK